MPLEAGNGWNVEEEPLASLVLHRWLLELDFNSIVWMSDNLGDLGLPTSSDHAIDTFDEVDDTRSQGESPRLITDAVVPEGLASEWRNWLFGVGISHETPSRVSVQSKEEDEGQMMSVPEDFERLVTDFVVGGGVHQEHAQQHNMTSDTTGVRVVNLQSGERPGLKFLDIEEVDIVSGGMDNAEEEQAVCTLSMEPLRFVQRQPSNLGSHNTQDGPAHGKQYQTAIIGEDQTSTTRNPDRVLETVEKRQTRVLRLLDPSVCKEAPVRSIPEYPKEHPSTQEFPVESRLLFICCHLGGISQMATVYKILKCI